MDHASLKRDRHKASYDHARHTLATGPAHVPAGHVPALRELARACAHLLGFLATARR
ncbi:hypothetical protein J7I98_25695 [Streptomyces sp. ISL-98]|nr:hypothetical protein [Streptomyces sp. ISL-98]